MMPKLLMSHFDNLRWSKFTKEQKNPPQSCVLSLVILSSVLIWLVGNVWKLKTFDDFVDNKDVAAEGFLCTNFFFFFDTFYPNISTHILHNIL